MWLLVYAIAIEEWSSNAMVALTPSPFGHHCRGGLEYTTSLFNSRREKYTNKATTLSQLLYRDGTFFESLFNSSQLAL